MSNWRDDALCRRHDPELWFPVAGPTTDVYKEQVREAKGVCTNCPVREQCLEWALERLPIGVAGGLDEHERARLRRRARVSA
jgi:WhiB family redox-sensing transcriptional regulator